MARSSFELPMLYAQKKSIKQRFNARIVPQLLRTCTTKSMEMSRNRSVPCYLEKKQCENLHINISSK